jgi:haloalkane dehalogenase
MKETTYSAKPFAKKKFVEISSRRMACIDEGEGPAIVFAHGNPTSSYVWRTVMPHLEGLGRLVACDMIGMGDSEKLPNSGPDNYSFFEQRRYLHELWDKLELGDEVVFVLHDWGSALGFDWANHHRDRVQGIAYMESIVAPLAWSDFPENVRDTFKALRSPAGEKMVLEENVFIEQVLFGSMLRRLTEEEKAEYRRPYLTPGEDRRPTLSWPRQLPLDGQPAEVVRVVQDYSRWLARSRVPKLYFRAEPGALDAGNARAFCRQWPNQKEIAIKGIHYVQEDSAHEIGVALADFVRGLRKHTAVRAGAL